MNNNDFLGLRDNQNGISKSEIVTLEGKQYIKASATMIKEGVFKGVFLPFDVLAASLNMWQGRPIVIPLHLQEVPIDTWPIELKEAHTFGFIDNPKLDYQNKAIKADLLFDLEKLTNSPYKSVPLSLLSNEPINNSVGLFPKLKQGQGIYNGVKYSFALEKVEIADHLAVLPYNLGACDLKQGCGVGLSDTKKGGTTMPENTEPNGFDYEKFAGVLGKVIKEALKETNQPEAVQLSGNEQLCEVKALVAQLSGEIEQLKAEVKTAAEATNNKLTLVLQAGIEAPNGITTGGDTDSLVIGFKGDK